MSRSEKFLDEAVTGAIDAKLISPIVHDRTSPCTDPEVKMSKIRVKAKFFFTVCIGCVALSQPRSSLAATADGHIACRPSRLAL